MAFKDSTILTSLSVLLLLLFSSLLFGTLFKSGHGLGDIVSTQQVMRRDPEEKPLAKEEETSREEEYWFGGWKKIHRKARRSLMVGSTAPTCTYNECRGCRFKCTAEQIPVDAGDPINTAYHYRCVCHLR